jgi:hypothetical protein
MDDSLDFVIVGAQKAGSTQLSEHLARVDGVRLPRGEDPCFESPYYETGSVDRLRHEIASHRREGEVVGLKRPSYLGIAAVPRRIADQFPHTKILIVLRDPVDRAVSAYFHKAQYGHIRLLPASEALSRLLDGDDLGSPRAYETLHWSRYSLLVPRWQKLFGEAVLVVGNGDLRADEPRVIRSVTEHLGVPYHVSTPVPDESNVGAKTMLEMRLRRGMSRSINSIDPMTWQLHPRTSNPLRLAAGGVFRQGVRLMQRATQRRSDALVLDDAVRDRLRDYFSADYTFVADQLDIRM